MMVLPDKKERELRNILDPWVLFNLETDKHYLDPKAPSEIKKIYLEYRKICNLEDFWEEL